MNGDGIDDIISGSYMPGHIYIFEGLGKGSYAKKRELVKAPADRFDLSLSTTPVEDLTASVPFAFDYDGDGDLDLVVGNIGGDVLYLPNEGDVRNPRFDLASASKIRVNGHPLRAQHGDTGPVIVDWDGDDLPDLIVGAGDGGVTCFKNVGTRTAPEFESGTKLILPTDLGGDESRLLDQNRQPTRSGMRAKVCVTDYNADGRLDLLVGDFMTISRPAPNLTDEQRARRDELREKQASMSQKFSEFYQRYQAENDDKDLSEVASDPEYQEMMEAWSEISNELMQLEAGFDYHGYVWVYLQKPDKGNESIASPSND